VYAYVRGVWEPCTSTYYAAFQGHSWKEIGLLAQELNQRRRRGEEQRRMSASRLADFLLGVWDRQSTYAERVRHQRERDQEMVVLRTGGSTGEAAQLAPPLVAQEPRIMSATAPVPKRSRPAPPGAHAASPSPLDRARLSALPVYR
jgi:hypothetical protein